MSRPRPAPAVATISGGNTQTQLARGQHSEFAHLTLAVHDLDARRAPNPDGSAGKYDVRVILGPPGSPLFRADVNLPELLKEGDSLLALPPAVREIQIHITTDDGIDQVVRMVRNSHGRVAAALLEFEAQSFADAENKTLDLVLPHLSWWSVRYDVPLEMVGYVIAEVATGTTRASFGLLGSVKQAVQPFDDFSLEPRIRILLSAYRQGICATDFFVAALSFWRVIEGVNHEREGRRKRAKQSGLIVADVKERIPNSQKWLATHDEWLRPLFSPYLGKRFTVVTESLRETVRNALAHIDPDKPILSLDRNADRQMCLNAIPVLRFMARSMLRTELGGDTGLGALFSS